MSELYEAVNDLKAECPPHLVSRAMRVLKLYDAQITQLKEQVEAMSNDFRAINGELTASLIEVKFEREELRAQLAQQPASAEYIYDLIDAAIKKGGVLEAGDIIRVSHTVHTGDLVVEVEKDKPASAVPDEYVEVGTQYKVSTGFGYEFWHDKSYYNGSRATESRAIYVKKCPTAQAEKERG